MMIDYKATNYRMAPGDSVESVIIKLNIYPLSAEELEYFMSEFKSLNKDAILPLHKKCIVPIRSEHWDEYLKIFNPFDHFAHQIRLHHMKRWERDDV